MQDKPGLFTEQYPLEGWECVNLSILKLGALLEKAIEELVRIRSSLEREHFQGRIDPRDLSANDQLQLLDLKNKTPMTPWTSVFIINDGPNTVDVGINEPDNAQEIRASETRTIDYTKADTRIEKIYYKCPTAGQTASLRFIGSY